LIQAVEENQSDLWQKVEALSKISPVKCVFRFNSSSFHGVRVAQLASAYVEPCTLVKGCPRVLKKLVAFCESNTEFIAAVRQFTGSRLDVTVKASGDAFLGVSLAET
jgi:hypothetical protein